MTIRSILTSYTGSGGGAAALHMSVLMAQKYDARITGAVWQPPSPLRKRSAAFLTRDIDTILDQMETEFVDERRRAFDRTVAEAGLADRADFVALASTGRTLVELARAQGIASEVVPAFCDAVEDWFNLDGLAAAVFTDNPASRRVLEKSGFEVIGTKLMISAARSKPEDGWILRRTAPV